MTVLTPADLSLELNVSPKRIRDVLRERFGVLPEGVGRWELTDDQADFVRSQLPRAQNPLPAGWTLEIGDEVPRRALHEAYRGSQQSGIVTLTTMPDILIFTDVEGGSDFGYDQFEGLQPDGSFAYTGQGQRGDQTFQRGNLALRDSGELDRPIRLLSVHGTRVTYVGRFATGDPTCRIETIPDADGNPRSGIIFNLVPVDADTAYLRSAVSPGPSGPVVATWSPPDASDVAVVREDVEYVGDRVVSRIEFGLQADFGLWLRAQGHEPNRLLLQSDATTIEPDLYVEAWGWVVEAKKSTAREYVRTAIGQVLDYVHVARQRGMDVTPVILLPGRPSADLMDLMRVHGITVVLRQGVEFVVIAP